MRFKIAYHPYSNNRDFGNNAREFFHVLFMEKSGKEDWRTEDTEDKDLAPGHYWYQLGTFETRLEAQAFAHRVANEEIDETPFEINPAA